MNAAGFMDLYRASFGGETLPAKRMFVARKELNRGMKEERRLALTMAGVVDRDLDDAEGLQASDFTTYQIFEPGDLAFRAFFDQYGSYPHAMK